MDLPGPDTSSRGIGPKIRVSLPTRKVRDMKEAINSQRGKRDYGFERQEDEMIIEFVFDDENFHKLVYASRRCKTQVLGKFYRAFHRQFPGSKHSNKSLYQKVNRLKTRFNEALDSFFEGSLDNALDSLGTEQARIANEAFPQFELFANATLRAKKLGLCDRNGAKGKHLPSSQTLTETPTSSSEKDSQSGPSLRLRLNVKNTPEKKLDQSMTLTPASLPTKQSRNKVAESCLTPLESSNRNDTTNKQLETPVSNNSSPEGDKDDIGHSSTTIATPSHQVGRNVTKDRDYKNRLKAVALEKMVKDMELQKQRIKIDADLANLKRDKFEFEKERATAEFEYQKNLRQQLMSAVIDRKITAEDAAKMVSVLDFNR